MKRGKPLQNHDLNVAAAMINSNTTLMAAIIEIYMVLLIVIAARLVVTGTKVVAFGKVRAAAVKDTSRSFAIATMESETAASIINSGAFCGLGSVSEIFERLRA